MTSYFDEHGQTAVAALVGADKLSILGNTAAVFDDQFDQQLVQTSKRVVKVRVELDTLVATILAKLYRVETQTLERDLKEEPAVLEQSTYLDQIVHGQKLLDENDQIGDELFVHSGQWDCLSRLVGLI